MTLLISQALRAAVAVGLGGLLFRGDEEFPFGPLLLPRGSAATVLAFAAVLCSHVGTFYFFSAFYPVLLLWSGS